MAITFSTRPFTLREMALSQKMSQGDYAAVIDLMVSRADPPISANTVGALVGDEINEAIDALGQSFKVMGRLHTMLSDVLRPDGR